jgi:hypothetical protein
MTHFDYDAVYIVGKNYDDENKLLRVIISTKKAQNLVRMISDKLSIVVLFSVVTCSDGNGIIFRSVRLGSINQ